MTVITMSRTELSRLRVMIELADRRTRVVYRLLDAFHAHGPDALISRGRGKPSKRAHGAAFSQTCLAIVRERYEDFGATLAADPPVSLPARLPRRGGSRIAARSARCL